MSESKTGSQIRSKLANLSTALIFAATLLAAPLYVWRFSVMFGGVELPTNFLMIYLFLVIGIGLVQVARDHGWSQLKQSILGLGKPLLISIIVFIVASLISLFSFDVTSDKISQWVVLYLQPITIFFLIRYFIANGEVEERILYYIKIACYGFVFLAGLVAFAQYFTLIGLPPDWQGNSVEPKRAIAFFSHPNSFSLFVTPLLAWLIPDVITKLRQKNWLPFILWSLGGLGILLSLSRGAWLGLIAAFGIYVLINANKKLILGFLGVLVVIAGVVAVVPNLRYRVLLPFHGEKSSVARFSLWNTGSQMLRDNPVLGKGVNGFKNNWDKYNTDKGLEHYNFPHNIFLNFWIDSGMLGLVSMLGIILIGAWRGLVARKDNNKKSLVLVGLLLFIVAMFVHGLIDIPYFKNDLALVFWMIFALSI